MACSYFVAIITEVDLITTETSDPTSIFKSFTASKEIVDETLFAAINVYNNDCINHTFFGGQTLVLYANCLSYL